MRKGIKKAPTIRFRGFTDDWEQRNLSKVVSVCSGMDYKHLSTGNIPVYGTGGYMLSVNKALSYDRDAIGIGRKGTIDKPYILRAPFWTVDTLFYAIPQNEACIDFVYDLFQNVNWKKKDESTGVPSLSKVAINNTNVIIPSEVEQRKIGSFTSQLDILLTLHQSKLDQLKTLKKYFLQNMFPAKGEKVPRIRFKGFTGDWEQCKLGSIAIINPKSELPEQFKYIDLESVVGTSLLGYSVVERENAPSRAQRLAIKGDVFYQTVRPYQRNNYLYEETDRDYVFSTGYAQLRTSLDSYFLLTLLQNDNFVKIVLDNCTGTSYPAINSSALSKIPISTPKSIDETIKIGNTFRKLDNLITLHQRKLDQLQTMKKFMLQNLFI